MARICNKCGRQIKFGEYSYEGECEECFKKEMGYKEEIKQPNIINENEDVEKVIIYTNQTASAIRIIGFIEIICSIVLGMILLKKLNTFIYFIISSISGIIIGTFILGFAEIIQKLQNIEDNTKK